MAEKEDNNKQSNGTHKLDLDQFTESKIEKLDNERALQEAIEKVKTEITAIESELGGTVAAEDEEADDWQTFVVPEHCVPIRADVRNFNFDGLAKEIQFDVIVMDPPWQLASSAPSRGVAIGYQQLPAHDISRLPVAKLQKPRGFLFIWVINARYSWALNQLEEWGYDFVDDITWVKTTVNRRMAKSHGFYLQHAKETCLVGRKRDKNPKANNNDELENLKGNLVSDLILAERRGQSQKPEELYSMIEMMVPNGKYLEIFARRNNLRNYWVSIGNEL